jgi:hypothetical protein
MKPTSQKRSKTTNPKLQTVLTVDDFVFIITVVSNTSKDILEEREEKQEAMYEIIEE